VNTYCVNDIILSLSLYEILANWFLLNFRVRPLDATVGSDNNELHWFWSGRSFQMKVRSGPLLLLLGLGHCG
jgi:hypothetical protein